MKRAILFLAILASVVAVKAQNVGISDQLFTPNTRLHVRGDAGNNVTLTIERTTGTTSALLFIPDNNFTTIQSQATATSTVARPMRFNVGTTEAMRIIVGGNVGIGTTTPTALLDVNGSVLGHYYRTYANNTDYNMFTRNGGGSAVYINQIDAISPILRLSSGTATANSNVVMTVENNGSVGLGVLAPTARLHVNGTVRFQGLNTLSGFTTALVVDVNGNVQARSLDNVAFNGYTETDPTAWRLTGNAALATDFIGTTNAIDFRMFTSNLERMRITSAGNVGIGTATPGALLHVSGQTANIGQGNSLIVPGGFGANIVIGSINQILDGRGTTLVGYQNTSSGVFGNIVGVRNNITTGTSGGHIFGLDNVVSATDAFAIGTFVSNSITQSIQIGWNTSAGPGAMTIRSTGNIGIGVTDPTSRLHVNGTVRFQGLNTLSGFTTALVVDVNGNVQARSLDNVAFNGYTETDPTAWRLTGNAALATNFIGTTNAIDFRMVTSNLERMRITSAGNVGINITTPRTLLDVRGNTAINIDANTGLHSHLTVRQTTNPISGSNVVLAELAADFRQHSPNNAWGSGIKFTVGNGDTYTGTAAIVAERTGSWSQGKLHFAVNNVGASGKTDIPIYMTIDGPSGGNVGIGTTAPTYKLHVIGRFKSDGINETSDVRLKKNIEPLQNSLDKILAMQGVTYEWNKEGMEEGVQIGLIAQEVEQILPEIVDTDSEGYKSIQYSVLVAVLIEGMKEQQAEYDALLLKVQQLESDMATIKAMMGIGEVEGEISVSR